MSRVKRGVTTKAGHKKLFSRTKGMKAGRRNQVRLATQAFLKAGTNAYKDRRRKKRDFRGAFIISINAACRENGVSYSKFVNLLNENKIELDRKVLSDLAKNQPEIFKKLVANVL